MAQGNSNVTIIFVFHVAGDAILTMIAMTFLMSEIVVCFLLNCIEKEPRWLLCIGSCLYEDACSEKQYIYKIRRQEHRKVTLNRYDYFSVKSTFGIKDNRLFF